jgi:hypothetical protein
MLGRFESVGSREDLRQLGGVMDQDGQMLWTDPKPRPPEEK